MNLLALRQIRLADSVVGLVVWYYFLVDRIARPQLDTSMIEGVGIYWGAWGLAWNGVILAFVITAIWGYHLFNRRSLHHLCERRIQRTWVMGAKPQYRPRSQGVPKPESTEGMTLQQRNGR